MKTGWKERDAGEREGSAKEIGQRERDRKKECRTQRERGRGGEREREREREREAGELCSVVTGAQSENSNLVITAHCCLHGKGGGGEWG